PAAQKSYLVAALGSLSAEEHAGRRTWVVPAAVESPDASEAMAAVADALALRIAADGKLHQLQPQLAVQTRAAEQAVAEVRQRDAELAELRGQLVEVGESARRAEAALREAQTERARAANEAEALRRRLATIEADLA